jgi:hypothetical protein
MGLRLVRPLDPAAIRASFVNSSRSRLAAMTLPDLAALPWDDLDFLGWRDGKAPDRAYLVVPQGDDVVGLAMRAGTARRGRRPGRGSAVCNLCHSGQPADGVSLFVAPRRGAAGRDGNTVGTYICDDLACSLYLRGLRELTLPQAQESLTLDDRVARLRTRLDAFVAKVLAA